MASEPAREAERIEVSDGKRVRQGRTVRQGPCGLPAVFAARTLLIPSWRSFAHRCVPRFHCFQIMDRNRRRIHLSSFASSEKCLTEAEVALPAP